MSGRTVTQERIGPGPLRDLKRYLYALYLQAGPPSLDEITERVRLIASSSGAVRLPLEDLSRDAVHRCLRNAELTDQDVAVTVGMTLALWIGVDASDTARTIRHGWAAERLNPTRPLRRIGDWSLAELRVHRAVDTGTLESATAADEPPTPYLDRPHDARLREFLRAAQDGGSVFAVLVGRSSTGKSRAMAEAVAACLPDWPVLFPRNASQLREWADSDAVDARTVLWLDEAQRFLPHAAEAISVLVERIPLAIVGSVWPTAWDELRTPPAEVGGPADTDDASSCRWLIENHAREIPVPDQLPEDELTAFARLGAEDRRIGEATRAARRDRQAIQHLTGGPELVRRYRSGTWLTPIQTAIVEAALDARRLGHESPIAPELLTECAASQLPSTARVLDAPDGIEAALRDLSSRVKNAPGPLHADRQASGFGPPDGYDPVDYLDQYARLERRFLIPRAEVWAVLAQRARTSADLLGLARSAALRWRLEIAAGLFKRAGELPGEPASTSEQTLNTLNALVEEREKAGRPRDAELHAALSARLGDGRGFWRLARLRYRAGDSSGAALALSLAAEHGDSEARRTLAQLHGRLGNADAARGLVGKAVSAGDDGAPLSLLIARGRPRDRAEIDEIAAEARAAGNGNVLMEMADLKRQRGDREGAERLYTEAARAGAAQGWREAGRLRESVFDLDRAQELYRRAVRDGFAAASADLERLGEPRDDRAPAPRGTRDEAQDGRLDKALIEMRRRARDRSRGARSPAAPAVARIVPGSAEDLAAIRSEAHRHLRARAFETAGELALRLADAGDASVLRAVGLRLHRDPRWQRIMRFGLDAGGAPAAPW